MEMKYKDHYEKKLCNNSNTIVIFHQKSNAFQGGPLLFASRELSSPVAGEER